MAPHSVLAGYVRPANSVSLSTRKYNCLAGIMVMACVMLHGRYKLHSSGLFSIPYTVATFYLITTIICVSVFACLLCVYFFSERAWMWLCLWFLVPSDIQQNRFREDI